MLERETVLRGLITAVLGIEVLEARGPKFDFLPSLAFAVILPTNLILLIDTIRARNLTVAKIEEAAAKPAAQAS